MTLYYSFMEDTTTTTITVLRPLYRSTCNSRQIQLKQSLLEQTFTATCPSCCPTSSVKALKAHCLLSCSVIEIVKISCIKIFHVLVAISKGMWQ